MSYDLILDRVLKIINFLKQAREVILIYSDGKVNKAATFWKVTFSSVILFSALSPLLLINYQIRKVNEIEKKISNDIDRIISQCGFNSFVSWIRIDGINVEIRELRGYNDKDCMKGNDCIKRHLEFDNKECYSKIPPLDANTFDLLDKTDTGQVKNFDDLEDWRKYDSAYKVLSCTKLHMDEVGFTIVKDFKNDTIYAFTLYFAESSVKNCKEPWLMLQEFGLRVKGYL